MTDDEPIHDAELAPLFAGLAGHARLLLAVSGGADSMALMHLIARWRAHGRADATRDPEISVATVDHGLRPGSHAEALAVGDAARALGFPHHVLSWTDRPRSRVQEAAREARYRLLTAHLRAFGEPHAALVTAHTADDQAETLLMRLARGSGLDGLSAMAAARPLTPGGPGMLVRPLLGVGKHRLLATLRAGAIGWVEDPSNRDPAFERVRLREAAGTLAALGLTADKLALSARRLGRARLALDAALADFEARVLATNAGAYAAIERHALAAAPEDLRLRLFERVLAAYGGSAPPPRTAEVEALMQRLDHASNLTATLGGCLIAAGPSTVRVSREPGRAGLPTLPVPRDTTIVWDDRFKIAIDRPAPQASLDVTVGPLGVGAYATIRTTLKTPLPSRIAATLPAFRAGERLLAVPAFGHRHAPCAEIPDMAEWFFHVEFIGLPDDTRNCTAK